MKNMTKQDLISFVDDIAELHDQGLLPFAIHLPGGNEDELLSIFEDINDGDYVLSTHRNWYHALLHGIPAEEVKAKILSGRSMFMFNREKNFYVSAIIGGTPAIAAGIAKALKQKGSDKKVWCFVGDGIEDTGHFAEAVRYVDGHNLPCKFVIEDDGMAVEAPTKIRWGTDKKLSWPQCVFRYQYTKSRPHIRTGNFAPLEVMKQTMKSDEEYFPRLNNKYQIKAHQVDLNYKDAITQAMTELGNDDYHFIGYSILPGDAMGTLKDVPENQKTETPVAENLMVGLAIGMSFEGIKSVVYFERHDFMLVAADAIGNHVDKINRISHGEFKVPIILKTVVDDGGLFYSGPTHSQNFTDTFRAMVDFPVIDAMTPSEAYSAYNFARSHDGPVMVVEHKQFF